MKIIKIIINVTIPVFLLMLFASFLTTKQYLLISKDKYSSHENVYFDHEYVADRVMGYLNYRYDDLNIGEFEGDDSELFRDTEISHMVDVKNLYTMLRLVALGSLFIGVSLSIYVYKKDVWEFYKTYKRMYIGPIAFSIFLGAVFAIDFNGAFTIFHKIFFTNDDWQLYSTDALIILLPLNFWLVSASIILLLFIGSLGLIYMVNEKLIKNKVTPITPLK